MFSKTRKVRKGLSLVAATGLTASLAVAMPLSASAAQTVISFEGSTTAADYPFIIPTGGAGGTSWAVWPDDDLSNQAAGIAGATNWHGRTGWTEHNFAVQDDGSGTNNALWIQKAKAGCPDSGVQLTALKAGDSMLSISNKMVSMKIKATDAYVPVEAVLTDSNGAHAITVTSSTRRKNVYSTVKFDFANPSDGDYDPTVAYSRLSLVLDPANGLAGTGTNWGTCDDGANVSKLYLVDDVSYTPSTLYTTPAVKMTFEDTDTLGALAVGDITGSKPTGQFEGAGTGISATPPAGGTGKALEFNKAAAGQDYSGFIAYVAESGKMIGSDSFKIVSFNYYSPDVVPSPVTLKIERATEPSYNTALEHTFVATQGWNSFSIDITTMKNYSAERVLTKLVIFPDFDAAGDTAGATFATKANQKYYIDNILFNGYGLAVKSADNEITGTARAGQTLTASTGTWTGNSVVFTYQWYRCTVTAATTKTTAPVSADKCLAISKATGATYKLVTSDRSKYVRVLVTATTSAGKAYSLSKSTAKVG